MPVLFGDEALDLALALADELERDRLHAAGGEAAADLVPQERADLVAHQPVEHAARLLRVDHLHVDLARMLERLQHAFFVISLNISRRMFVWLRPPSSSAMCQPIASPSRSGSVAT